MKVTINEKVIDISKILMGITIVFAFLRIINVTNWPVWVVFLPVIVILVVDFIAALIALIVFWRMGYKFTLKKSDSPFLVKNTNGKWIIWVFIVYLLALVGTCILLVL